MNQSLISIIVPAFNPTGFLPEALNSLFEDPTPKEVIVVDDGSVKGMNLLPPDLPIRIIRNPKNLGPAAAMNVGIREAIGEFISFMDQDDIAIRGSLRWRIKWLQQNPHEMAVMGALAGILDERPQNTRSFRMVLKRRLVELPERLDANYFKSGGWVPLSPLSLCVFRSSLIEKVGFLDESLRRAHDREYLYRMLKSIEIPFIDRSVLFYRVHDSNLSIRIEEGKIVPNPRTVAELFLINKAYGFPFPQ